jgi:DNA-binding transcriptional ArsR family regulator
VSRHLAVLRHAGLVQDHRAGKRVFYALDRRLERAVCRFIEKVETPDKKE